MVPLEKKPYASRILLPVIMSNNVYVPVLIIYAVVTVIIWRNVDFRFTFKTVFSLLSMPVFVAGMVINLWMFEILIPSTFDAYDMASGGGRYSEKGVFAFILSVPIALAMSYAWYRFILYLDCK